MPIYEYKCQNCGEVFEVKQKFSDEPLTTHEKCGGKVERLISAPALQFKGSGWYVTDYARSGSNGGTQKSSSSDSKSAADSGAKSETKSETKSESKPASSDKPKSD